MNLSERITELTRVLRSFSAAPAPAEAAPLAFSDYKLEDGTIVRVDGELAVGTLVYVVTEEGLLPAPDGAHSIPEVGVVTTEGGKIVEIGEPAPAQPEAVAAQEVEIEVSPEGEGAAPMPVEEKVAALESAVAALAAKVEELMAKMGGEIQANATRFSTIDTAISALAQMPTAAPKKRASDAVVESVKMSRASRIAELNETLKNLKK